MVEVRDGKDRAGGDSMWGNRAEETGVEGRGLGRTGLAFQAWKVASLSWRDVVFALKCLKLPCPECWGVSNLCRSSFQICNSSAYGALIVCLVLPSALCVAWLLCSGGNSSPSGLYVCM